MRKYILSTPGGGSGADYESELNPQQLAVVTAPEGPVQVIAGAGSGKTRTLTYRVAWLVDQGIEPSMILLCTFTNKAAREMLARVEHLVQSRAREVWGGTFHHIANKILREFASVVGSVPEFSILDQEDARDIMAACMADIEKKGTKRMLPRPAVLCDLVSFASNTLTPLDQVLVKRAPKLLKDLDEILALARAYRDRKREMHAMDFDDLLINLHGLLNGNSKAAAEVSGRFRHVLVDEYQDTNLLQSEIVDRLARVHGNLTVVGDDAQSIYAFRGANPDNMFRFNQRWPSTQMYKLETNYRSTPEILNLANRSIANNRKQMPKQLVAVRAPGNLPAMVTVRDADVQAAFVAQRILELASEGTDLKDMAVLYRAHHHSLELQVELTRREIPYRVRSGVRFFEQAHVKDVLAHIRILENPLDELGWLRVLRMQGGIGRTGAMKIFEKLRDADSPIDKALALDERELSSRSRPGWSRFQMLLRKMVEEGIRCRTSSLIQALLEHGYGDLLPSLYPNPESRKEDIEQLAAYADHFESPGEFLSELNLISEFGAETIGAEKKPDDHLVLSTIHQAKGLEWNVVFVIGLNEGQFPHPRALSETDGEEEERRLFYVSITRSRDDLYLVSPLVADRYGRRRVIMKSSRFLNEVASEELVERWSVEERG